MHMYICICVYSIAIPRVLFDLAIEKKIQPSLTFPPLYWDFDRLLIANFIDT